MIPLDEARAFVLESCPVLAPRTVPIDEALGCVNVVRVVATQAVPPFVNSSMDGYAVHAVDTADATPAQPARLEVVGTILAGSSAKLVVRPGQAARIMTGAPLPPGADAISVVEVSAAEDGGRTVAIRQPSVAGAFIRTVGQDVRVGEPVVEVGVELSPGHLGSLANQGISDILVHPRPRVGVLSTGDELVAAGRPLTAGGIRDANRPSLLALVRREGWDPVDLGIVGDDTDSLGATFDDAGSRCDVLITSGGVSVGDADVVKLVLQDRCGNTMRWMQVAIRPAKPFAFGLLEGTGIPVFGLPGNPVSAMVSFELLVRPSVRQMVGHARLERLVVPAVADRPYARRPDGKTHFVRAVVSVDGSGAWSVRPLEGQESHQLSVMAGANALAVVPDGNGFGRGEPVDVLVIAPERLTMDS